MKTIKNLPSAAPRATSHNQYCGFKPTTYNILCGGEHQNLRLSPSLTPVNTGKVLIGSAYQPNPCHVSEDQLWLQDALLEKYREPLQPYPTTLADKVIIALAFVSLFVVWFLR